MLRMASEYISYNLEFQNFPGRTHVPPTNQCLSHLKKLQFLGFLIDTEKMIVTQEKKDRLVEEQGSQKELK
jgi:hypothetical protein